jgi:hypothetical protein
VSLPLKSTSLGHWRPETGRRELPKVDPSSENRTSEALGLPHSGGWVLLVTAEGTSALPPQEMPGACMN